METKFSEIETLADLVVHLSGQHSNSNFANFLNNGVWISHSTRRFLTKTYNLAENLKKLGVKKGDRIALFSESSPYWLICDLATQLLGAVVVPMFTNISQENLKFQLQDSEADYAFIIGSDKWQVIKPYAKKFKYMFTHELKIKHSNAKNLSELMASKSHKEPNFFKFTKNIKPSDLATIIYTSGSTGNPKGVCLSHGNLVSQIKDTRKSFSLLKDDVVLSYLPLAHIFERMVMYFYISKNISIYFADDVLNVANLLQEIKPTMITTVPRLLEKIYAKIELKISDAPKAKKTFVMPAIWYAKHVPVHYGKYCFFKKFFHKILYKRLLKIMGGRIRLMISGGAPLDPDISRFFLNIGLPIMEGYGLTEASPVIAANTIKHNKFSSVGRAFPSVKIKISEDGEILARGPNVMLGYLYSPDKTAEVMDNGWLKTGDMGYLDKEGYLFITGRIKELQKTSNGKYVPTVKLESKIKQIPLADNALVIADGKKFVSVIVFPDFNVVKQRKMSAKELDEYFSGEIDKVNKSFNHWEKVQRFIVAKSEPSVKNGEMTPSMKLRRHIILDHYKKYISNIYK